MNDPGGASTLTGVRPSRRFGGLVRPDPANRHKSLEMESV